MSKILSLCVDAVLGVTLVISASVALWLGGHLVWDFVSIYMSMR